MIENPVLRRELFLKMRFRKIGPAQFSAIAAVLLVLSVIYYETIHYVIDDPTDQAVDTVWKLLMGLQFAIVCLLAPVITANAISREREQQTWEVLQFTLLTPSEIVFGKLLARLAMLAAAFLPLFPLMLVICGFAAVKNLQHPEDTVLAVLLSYITTIISAVFFATCGLFMSWLLRRTIFAIMASYSIVIGGLTIGTALVTAVVTSISMDSVAYEKCPLIWINPAYLIGSALSSDLYSRWIGYVVAGLAIYVVMTALMLTHMIRGFRSKSA